MSFQEMERNTSTPFNGQNELTQSDLNESENSNDDVKISVGSAFTSKVEGIVFFLQINSSLFLQNFIS